MSIQHVCRCGSTVFTLAMPDKPVYLNEQKIVPFKVLTCMQCGSQDKPAEVEFDSNGFAVYKRDLEKEQALKALQAEREEYERYRCQPYQLLLAEWLKQFNKYANGGTHERPSRTDNERELDALRNALIR